MENVDIAREAVAKDPNAGSAEIAKKIMAEWLGRWPNLEAARACVKRVRAADGAPIQLADHGTPSEKLSRESAGTSETIDSVSRRIKTLDDLIKATRVDLDVWEVERHTVNKWEVGAKNQVTGKIEVEPLWQVKAWLKRKPAHEQTEKIAELLLAEFKKQSPKQSKRKAAPKGKSLLEIAIFDAHVGKLCWAAETGRDYDSKIAVREFTAAARYFLEKSKPFGVERILFPVGNDFLNSDNARGETTAGTPQDEDSRWQKSFCSARGALVESITEAANHAPVDVVVVSGNHDQERMFYMGDVLSAWFRNDPRVTIDNRPTLRKAYSYGKNFIGFTHGNKEKHLDLPLIFVHDYPQEWSAATTHEIHIGHFHQRQEKTFTILNDRQSVRQRIISSLAATDAWHKSKGYNGIRAAEAMVFAESGGCDAHLTYTPQA